MNSLTIEAKLRTKLGTTSSRKLRRDGFLPAIVYGNNKPETPIILDHNKLIAAEIAGNLFNNLLTLSIDGSKESVIIKDVQRHPFKPLFIHIDFLRINRKEDVTVTVPVEVINDEELTKLGAVINIVIQELEVTCLPEDIPTEITVDLSDYNIGDIVTLGDIKLDSKLSLKLLASNEESKDWPLINIDYPKVNIVETEEEEILPEE